MPGEKRGPGTGGPAAGVVEAVVAAPLRAADNGDGRRFSPYDHIRTPPERRTLRELPGLMHGALRLTWRAGRGPLVASGILQLVAGVGIAAQLLLARRFLAQVIVAEHRRAGFSDVWPTLLVLGGIIAFLAIAAAVQSEMSTLLSELMSRQASREILDVATAVDLEAYDTPGFHDRLQRAKLNADVRPVTAVNGLLGTIGGGFGVVGVAAALFAVQPLLVPVALAAIVPLWLGASANSKAFYRFTVAMTPSDRARNYFENVLSSKDLAKEVRAFALARYFRARFEALYEQRLVARRRLIVDRLRRSLLAAVASSAVGLASIALLVWLLLSGRTSLAAAGTGILGIIYLGQRLNSTLSSANSLYESALFIDDFTLFLELRDNAERARPPGTAPRKFECLAVQDLTFTYPGAERPVLREVSIEIRRGEVVALVGPNGSGKTTLAKLLALLYRPDSGRILWDDTDTSCTDPEALRRSITVIFQDFGRYWVSARDNIGVGDVDRIDDLDRIVAAAHSADANSFLAGLPRGYDTILSRLFEGGRDLSGGQWQRITLARTFFRDAPLIILDEPTASLDAETEYRLFQSIREMCQGRSVLLISHRFSSVRDADRIYVLDEGRVAEAGSHEELMTLEGQYTRMFSLQASAYLDSTRR